MACLFSQQKKMKVEGPQQELAARKRQVGLKEIKRGSMQEQVFTLG
jgi:hypothetical protein